MVMFQISRANKGVSCLCTFQLNNYGEVIPDTFVIPDYFISMSCLNQMNMQSKNWMSLFPVFDKNFTDVFDNQRDAMATRGNSSFTLKDLEELMKDLITVSGLTDFNKLISNVSVIYGSEIPVPNKFRNYKSALNYCILTKSLNLIDFKDFDIN